MIRLAFSFVILIVCQKIHGLDPITKDDTPRKNHAHRRAVDGSRGNKYYEPAVHDSFDIYGPYDEETDLSDYRINVPGEPGVDYPSYTRIPQTSFTCERQFRGYYADEEAGCQLFHVCDGNFLVSSFLCPIGSTFSQRYLTCDWWNKVDCSATKSFYQNETPSTSEVIDDDDEYLRKAYEMTSLQSSGNGVSAEPQDTPIGQLINETPDVNDLHSSEHFPDYSNDRSLDYSQYKYSSRYTNPNSASGNRGRNSRYYSQQSGDSIENNNSNGNTDDNNNNNNNNNYNDGDDQSSIKIHTIGRDRKDQVDTRYNDFRPSYAPTVPTVTTTTRRFYSPTIPSVVRSTPSRSRHDLEFESSDHLYSAKGKNRGRITPPRPLTTSTTTTTTTTTERITPVTPASIKSTSPFILEVPPILKEDGSFKLNKVSFPRPAIRLRANHNDDISTERSNSISDFSTIDLNPFSIFTSTEKPQQASESTEVNAYIRVSGTEKPQRVSEISSIEFYHYNDNSTDEQSNSLEQNDRAITRPSSSILPPFYYYSNADQHDNVLFEKSEELGNDSLLLSTPSLSPSPTTFSPEIINIPTTLSWFQTTLESPVTDVIPLFKNEVEIKEHPYSTTVKSVEKSSSSIINTTGMDLQREIIEPPSIIFNPPLRHSLIEIENSTYPPESYEYTLVDNKNVHISTASGEESSTISDLLLSSLENNSAKDSFEEVEDAAVGESSPLEVTLTVNNGEDLDPTGELIRSLIAQHDPTSSDSIRDIEIHRSNSRSSPVTDNYRRNKVVTSAAAAAPAADNRIRQRSRPRARIYATPTTYSAKRKSKLKLRTEDSSTDNLPRPFSLSPPSYFSDVTLPTVDFIEPRPVHPSRIRNTETVVKNNYEIGNTKHEGLLQSSETLFDLPKQDKLSDFQNSHDLPQRFKENSKPVIQKNETQVETGGKVLVETEIVPSLGFSLNTDEEREKFAHAVLHGLFSGVSAESNVKKKLDDDLKS